MQELHLDVNIIEDWAVIKGVSRLVASSTTQAIGVKVIICGHSIDKAVAQPFKMVEI